MPKVSLGEWASIAEVIGAVAIVISLIYVGLEINQNTTEVRESNRQELVNRSFHATGRVATNPSLATAFQKVSAGDELDPVEELQYTFFVRSMIYDIQEAFLLHKEGRLSEEYWRTRVNIFTSYMQNGPALSAYHRDKELGVLETEFVKWADKKVTQIGR